MNDEWAKQIIETQNRVFRNKFFNFGVGFIYGVSQVEPICLGEVGEILVKCESTKTDKPHITEPGRLLQSDTDLEAQRGDPSSQYFFCLAK